MMKITGVATGPRRRRAAAVLTARPALARMSSSQVATHAPQKKPQAPMHTHYAQGPATLMVEYGLLKCVHDTSKGYKPLH